MFFAANAPTLAAAEINKRPDYIDLHFFWSSKCPHCLEARPFITALAKEFNWVRLHSLELTGSKENVRLYQSMATKLGADARSVPAFFFCGQMYVGYDNPEGTGRLLRQALLDCKEGRQGTESPLSLPAGIDPEKMSLPLFTLTIAALDAFNPCAFFVLLFLLSLMVNARSRYRMAVIGGVFVFISGLIYFLFMAAWLELFLLIGALTWVTLIAGLLALIIGVLNIKDYFLFEQGPTLSIRDSAKPALFERMRNLLSAESMASMLVGTVTLAVAANSYELLCTAGFPMVYTRVLTLQAETQATYYLYLIFYNLVYVTPLLLIVLVFTVTMGRRKLSEQEGKTLKLLSGVMMAGLGLLLLIAPEALNNLATGIALLGFALVVTFAARRFDISSKIS